MLFTTATFPLFYLPVIILLEVQLFFGLNSALRKSFSSCNIKQSENWREKKISTTYGRQNNLLGIVLTYRKLEDTVILHENVYKCVWSQAVLGRQLEKQNSWTSQQLHNLLTFLVQKFCSIFQLYSFWRIIKW